MLFPPIKNNKKTSCITLSMLITIETCRSYGILLIINTTDASTQFVLKGYLLKSLFILTNKTWVI